jgi:hypothetical protein
MSLMDSTGGHGRGSTRALDVDLGARPLNSAERSHANEVAHRLRLELRSVLSILSPDDSGASAMSRLLGVDRNICQRVVAATARGEADVHTLVQLPGVAGLRQFLQAMSRRPNVASTERESISSATVAVDHFEKLLDELAGSQRKLKERLEVGAPEDAEVLGPTDDMSARQQLFRAAARVTGRWSESWISMRMIRPLPGDPLMTESLLVRGHIGHVSREGAVPLEVGENVQARLAGAPDGPAFKALADSEDPRRFLLAPFCSQPLPQVISRALGSKLVHVIEGNASASEASDIVIADRRARPDKHPATQNPPLGEVWSMITFPSRRLVFDVYLHKNIARRCIPSLEQHLWGPHSGQQGLWRWSTRFPGGPKLELLGPGIANCATSAYDRYAELTRHMFEYSGWEPQEFVGYRCDVPYPVWRAGYCMLFDFTGNELPEGRQSNTSADDLESK